MDKKRNEIIKMSYPSWFIVFISFCGIGTFLISTYYIGWVIYCGKLYSHLLGCLFFMGLIIASLWVLLRVAFYSVTGTDRGIITHNVIGQNKFFWWNEIVEVRRPHFGIPMDFSYVISKDKEKILLLRSMNNYKELVELIKTSAPNLT